MAPNQAEYEQFLQAAIERLTVGTLYLGVADAIPDADADLTCIRFSRRLLARINSKPL
jgi:hypothetical protein